MTQSMTGFARTEKQLEWATLSCEIRSVNQRFLDPNFRLPDALRQYEPTLREMLRKRINRGKLECSFRLTTTTQEAGIAHLNDELIQQLLSAVGKIDTLTGNKSKVNPLELLKWPGVLQEQEADQGALKELSLAMFSETIDQLIQMRQREGDELQRIINQRLDDIAQIVKQVRVAMPRILAANKERLLTKLAEFKEDLDPGRLEQELTMVAHKADVDEELDRLETHLTEVRNVFKTKGAVGRKLDFLMQELNREANTLSSKAIVSDTSLQAVELKVLIEQMREQIQNIE